MSVDYSKVENTVLNRTEEDYIMQNLVQMLDVIGEDYRLTPKERQTLASINHANKGFVQDAIEAIRAYSDMLPGYIKAPSIEKTWQYYIQLERAGLHLDRLAEVVRDRRQTAGALLFRDARSVYQILKVGDNHSIGGMEALLKRMKERFMGQGFGAPSLPQPEVEAEASVVTFTPESKSEGSENEEGNSSSIAA